MDYEQLSQNLEQGQISELFDAFAGMEKIINKLQAENRHLHKRLLELRRALVIHAPIKYPMPWYDESDVSSPRNWSEWLKVPEQDEETGS